VVELYTRLEREDQVDVSGLVQLVAKVGNQFVVAVNNQTLEYLLVICVFVDSGVCQGKNMY